MDASGKPAEGWSEEPWNRKIGEQLNEITRLYVAVELPAKAYGGSQEAALKMAEGQVKQSVVCIFLLGPGFFGDERTLQLLRVAIKHKKSIVLLLLPNATFRRTQLNEQDNKLKGLWQKLRATAVKVLNKVLNSRLMIVLAKIVPKDLLEFFKGGDGVSESELHLFPENAYNKEWTPYLPDVAEAFHAPPIPWEPQYKDACMAALLRRIGAGLRQQQVSGYVDVELSRICAEREGQQLAELSRLADASEPKGSKAYDLYVISNSSDLTPERLMTLYAPLASFGQSMNLGRFKINQWDEIEPAMRKCRRVALVLTRHGFDSVWAMRELQCAVQLEQQGQPRDAADPDRYGGLSQALPGRIASHHRGRPGALHHGAGPQARHSHHSDAQSVCSRYRAPPGLAAAVAPASRVNWVPDRGRTHAGDVGDLASLRAECFLHWRCAHLPHYQGTGRWHEPASIPAGGRRGKAVA